MRSDFKKKKIVLYQIQFPNYHSFKKNIHRYFNTKLYIILLY